MITHINPKTSRLAGGINIEINGSDLYLPSEESILHLSDVVDESLSGVVTENLGLELFVPNTTNANARVRIDKIFPEVFSLEINIEKMSKSFPSIHKSRTIEVEVKNRLDILDKVKIGMEYLDERGHQLFIETKRGALLLSKKERNINPNLIKSIRVEKSDKFIFGWAKLIDGSDIFIGKSPQVHFSSSDLTFGAIGPKTGYAREFNIKATKLLYHGAVFFCGEYTTIDSGAEDQIIARTSEGEIGGGDLIIFKSDFSILRDSGSVRYTLQGINLRLIKSFDTVQSVYREITDPLRKDLFNKNKSMKWDQDFFLSPQKRNQNLYVPTLWDSTTGGVPQSFFQSGVGTDDALVFLGIKKYISKGVESWYAHIKHGTYFVYNVPYYLFSDQSVIQYLDDLQVDPLNDHRSVMNLEFAPKKGIPLIASSLMEDKGSHLVLDKKRIMKRGKFSGIVRNGVELDPTFDPSLIDETTDEFIVEYNPNNRITNWTIETFSFSPFRDTETPLPSPPLFLYQIKLPQVPLRNFKVLFSRKDIFFTEKTFANRYGEGLYNSFLYGEGLHDLGDYAIDFIQGEVHVVTDREYFEMGTLSYDFAYPARVIFNKNFVKDYGSQIVSPSYSDLKDLDLLGFSSDEPAQTFRLSDFPIIDVSTKNFLDILNFKLFIYDDYQNTYDTSWTRVRSLLGQAPEAKVYVLDSENGTVSFGNDINGAIPEKYHQILAGYRTSLKLQYEPETSNDFWIGKSLDLNLDKSSLSTGFMYLSRRELIPNQLIVEFNTQEILSYETAEISSTVYSQDGDKIQGVKIHFEVINGNGEILDPIMTSDANGEARTFFTPSTIIEDMGIKIDLFDPSEDKAVPGIPQTTAYESTGGVPYKIIKSLDEEMDGVLEKMYLFMILDDNDPFLPYNNITRRGGRLVVLSHDEGGTKEVTRPEYMAGSALGFIDQLPQPFNPADPNYTPDLRGFYVVGKKTISLRGYVEVGDMRIYSDIINLKVQYSEVQLGQWTLPIVPLQYRSSQIDTATYIDLNHA